jgi:hypothetical protein
MSELITYLENYSAWLQGTIDDDYWMPNPQETTEKINEAIEKLKAYELEHNNG